MNSERIDVVWCVCVYRVNINVDKYIMLVIIIKWKKKKSKHSVEVASNCNAYMNEYNTKLIQLSNFQTEYNHHFSY